VDHTGLPTQPASVHRHHPRRIDCVRGTFDGERRRPMSSSCGFLRHGKDIEVVAPCDLLTRRYQLNDSTDRFDVISLVSPPTRWTIGGGSRSCNAPHAARHCHLMVEGTLELMIAYHSTMELSELLEQLGFEIILIQGRYLLSAHQTLCIIRCLRTGSLRA